MKDLLVSSVKTIKDPVLVTGHTGFKGTWMTLLLNALGISWVGISLPPKPNSLYQLVDEKFMEEHLIDLRDFDKLEKAIKLIKPRYVIHLAAQPLVLESYKNPRETFETNVLGTVNLLDILTKNSFTEKIIVVTTDKVYKEKKFLKTFREHDALGGKDPYSWSKVGTESVVGSWQQICKTQGGPKIVSVRAGNVIGGGDNSENRLLPDLIKGFIANSVINIRNPDSTRPWQHVLDPLNGYLLVLAANTRENAFNFSPNSKSMSVRKVTEIANRLWGGDGKISYSNTSKHLETKSLSLNSTKARKVLNWQSQWSQEEAVISTVSWWLAVTNKSLLPKEACLRDISELLRKH